ncbi:hypothetical protein [Muriicola marianensis]|uniref:hypothetical protein n=1 Tax=Muriicola marianensis TaxID=1324801 RepID=UPI00166D496F|nr:hypothetical protein [Muriicola marianensis]
MKYWVLLLLIIPVSAASQRVQGNYELCEEGGIHTHRIQLLDSSRFIKSSSVFLAHGSFFEKGYYEDKRDTLILHYEPYGRPKPWFEIERKEHCGSPGNKKPKEEGSYLTLSLELYDEERQPIESYGSFVNLYAKDSLIGSVGTDKMGRIRYSSSDDLIDRLEISSFGYGRLDIDLQPFRGYVSKVNIFLPQETHDIYGESSRTEKYLWRVRGKHLRHVSENGEFGEEYIKSEHKKYRASEN